MNKFIMALFSGIHILTLSQNNSLSCEHIEMPNVFTPNNDFKNDLFIPMFI